MKYYWHHFKKWVLTPLRQHRQRKAIEQLVTDKLWGTGEANYQGLDPIVNAIHESGYTHPKPKPKRKLDGITSRKI